jgi:hypothetical protein
VRHAAKTALLSALALALAAALPAAPRAEAGTIYLLNGEEIDGEIVAIDAEEVTIKFHNGNVKINLREVRDVELRPGESIWQTQVQRALEASRRKMAEESARKLAARLGAQAGAAAPALGGEAAPPVRSSLAPPSAPPSFEESLRNFVGKLASERWGFAIRYPGSWQAGEAEDGFFTFHDPRDAARAMWSFDVTAFDDFEADFTTVAERAARELEALDGYRFRSRSRPVRIDHQDGERTVGVYEKDGRAIRHDQVIVKTRRGVLLIHFFSPGAPLDDGGVPDVEGVIASIELR